jgi:predicted benzoate:H+ symporter BenE
MVRKIVTGLISVFMGLAALTLGYEARLPEVAVWMLGGGAVVVVLIIARVNEEIRR